MTPGASSAQSAEQSRPAIVVRSYNNFGISGDDLEEARDLVAPLHEGAGIDVTCLDCWYRDHEPAEASSRCRQPLAGNELVLRLQAGNATDRSKYASMGFSLVGPGQKAAFLSTVFANVVHSVASGAGIDTRQVLGLAIAHEIGHVLLNTNAHASTGLMRADWSRAELQRHAVADWRFLPDETIQMREAIEARGN